MRKTQYKCCTVNLLEIEGLLYFIKVSIVNDHYDYLSCLMWGQIYSGKQSFVQAKQHIYNALSSYYYAIKKGYKSCLCDDLVCKLIEKAKEITKSCKSDCRKDVYRFDRESECKSIKISQLKHTMSVDLVIK